MVKKTGYKEITVCAEMTYTLAVGPQSYVSRQ